MHVNDNQKLKDRLHYLLQTPDERALKLRSLTEENRQKLLSLKDIHRGERCFIIGSSPSLKQLDLTKLNNEFTFTVNRGYMLQKQGLLHSSYHVMSDIRTLKDDNVKNEIPNNFADKFLIYGGIDFPIKNNVVYFDYEYQKLKPEIIFQEDLTKPLLANGTVINFAIQFAYYLGFSEIIFIGVDLDFAKNSGHAYQETDGENIRQKDCKELQARLMYEGIEAQIEFLEQKGMKLYNASPAGILDCMPRIEYEELF